MTATIATTERTDWPGSGTSAQDRRAPERPLLDEPQRRTAATVVMLRYAEELGPDPALADVSDAELDRRIGVGAAEIAAATCRWLEHVAEFVTRGLWVQQGAASPSQWLSWKCGVAPSTAREHVRVALRLRECPHVRDRFAAGRLSYSKVRAITRVCDPEVEATLLAFADAAPAAQLERIVADTIRVRDLERSDVEAERRRVGVRTRHRPDGMVEVVLCVRPDEAAVVRARVDRLVELDRQADDDDDVERRPTSGEREVRSVLGALDAAVAAGPTDTSGEDRHLVVVHAPVDALAEVVDEHSHAPPSDAQALPRKRPRLDRRVVLARDGRGRARPMRVSTLRRLACDSRVDLCVDRDGSPHDLGRARREPSAALRRQLLARDRGCRFPRCGSRRRLHAHHCVHWEDGGPTDLDNLIMLCDLHHRFTHEHGWEVRHEPDRPGGFAFDRPGDSAPPPIVDRLPGASAEAVGEAARRHGLDLGASDLLPQDWDGRPHDHAATVSALFDVIADANRHWAELADAQDGASAEARSTG